MFLQEEGFFVVFFVVVVVVLFCEGEEGMRGIQDRCLKVQQYLPQTGTTEHFGQRVLSASSLPQEDVSLCQFPSSAPSYCTKEIVRTHFWFSSVSFRE